MSGSTYPDVYAGRGIVIERFGPGCRVSLAARAPDRYAADFTVLPVPGENPRQPPASVRVADASLSFEERADSVAGTVAVDCLRQEPSDGENPGQLHLIRSRFAVNASTALTVGHSTMIVYLRVSLVTGAGTPGFQHPELGAVHYEWAYLLSSSVPAGSEWSFCVPLAKVRYNQCGSKALTVTQLHRGEIHGVVMTAGGASGESSSGESSGSTGSEQSETPSGSESASGNQESASSSDKNNSGSDSRSQGTDPPDGSESSDSISNSTISQNSTTESRSQGEGPDTSSATPQPDESSTTESHGSQGEGPDESSATESNGSQGEGPDASGTTPQPDESSTTESNGSGSSRSLSNLQSNSESDSSGGGGGGGGGGGDSTTELPEQSDTPSQGTTSSTGQASHSGPSQAESSTAASSSLSPEPGSSTDDISSESDSDQSQLASESSAGDNQYYIIDQIVKSDPVCDGIKVAQPIHAGISLGQPPECREMLVDGVFQYSIQTIVLAGPFNSYEEAEAYLA